jgi:hypothetical protein
MYAFYTAGDAGVQSPKTRRAEGDSADFAAGLYDTPCPDEGDADGPGVHTCCAPYPAGTDDALRNKRRRCCLRREMSGSALGRRRRERSRPSKRGIEVRLAAHDRLRQGAPLPRRVEASAPATARPRAGFPRKTDDDGVSCFRTYGMKRTFRAGHNATRYFRRVCPGRHSPLCQRRVRVCRGKECSCS